MEFEGAVKFEAGKGAFSIDKKRRKWYHNGNQIAFQCLGVSHGTLGRIDNPVRFRNGTATVGAEVFVYGESRSLGDP